MHRAQPALDCVQSRPRDALAWSRQLLGDPTATAEERAAACWALGRAYSELDRLDQACQALDEGIAIAAGEALTELEAEIRVSLAVCLLIAGRTAEAREQLTRADPQLSSAGSRGRLVMQQGFIDLHLGALDYAVARFDEAEALLAGGADELARTRLLVNRALANTLLGHFARGEADARAARDLADSLGQHMLAAGATQNIGFAAGGRGDLPAALRWFGDARARYEELGSPRRVMLALEVDQTGVLLSGGLYGEAVATAQRAADLAVHTGNRLAEAEARLLLARAHLANGSAEGAEREAGRAAAIFRESERPPWDAQARYLGLQAAATSAPGHELLERAAALAEELAACGWRREALEVRTFAGRTALALGRRDDARRLLAGLEEAARHGSLALQATALLATASLQLADGDRAGAKAALSAGLGLVEEHRASLGSTELRAHISSGGADLAELGLQLATEDGDPYEVLAWAERWHAGALQHQPARAAAGSALDRALTELRQVHVAVMTGTVDPLDDDDPDRRIAALERRIRDLGRTVAGPATVGGDPAADGAEPGANGADPGGDGGGLDRAKLRRSLAGRVLVEYYTVRRELFAVTVTDTGPALHALGSIDPIAAGGAKASAALGRLAYRQGSAPALAATRSALEATADELDERLVRKLGLPADGDVVIVPTGPLQALPWALLPSLARRVVIVTPSGGLWCRRGGTDPQPGARSRTRTVLVCGPDLPGGGAEIEQLRSLHPEAAVLDGESATVAAVTAAMAGADLVHLAAHGRFRADNPMFSSLGLHDGPLTVYDLEALEPAPTTVILPACDAARSSVRHGDELVGTAAALLQIGVGTVIAPVTVVPDTEITSALMTELHRLIQGGQPPARALALARRGLVGRYDELDLIGAASFVAIGTCRS